jgi:hypothetical protein
MPELHTFPDPVSFAAVKRVRLWIRMALRYLHTSCSHAGPDRRSRSFNARD